MVARKLTVGNRSGGRATGVALGLGPGSRHEGFHFGSFRLGQPFKNILKIFGRIDAVAAATAQHRVDHRAALARLGMPDEQKVLLPDRRGPKGILTKIMPPPDLCRVAKLEAHIAIIPMLIGDRRAA